MNNKAQSMDDAWSIIIYGLLSRSISTLTSIMGSPIGAQRLGKPHSRPSIIVGIIINKTFY